MRISIVSLAFLSVATPAFGQAQVRINAGEEPEQKPWSQPASISYTSVAEGDDSFAIDFAGRVDVQPDRNSTATVFVRAVAQVNTQEKKQVQNFEGQLGYAFDFDTASQGPASDAIDTGAWYFFGDAKLGIQDKTIFADKKADCTVVPLSAECGRQHETNLRGTIQIQPFRSDWEQTMYQDPETKRWSGLSYSISPVVSLFYDHVLAAKINASGIRPEGSVYGARIEMNAAFAPGFLDYRAVVRGKVQLTQAFHRAELRREAFEKSAMLYKASLDYELGRRSFDTEGSKWIPAVGVSYTYGDDPLTGKNDQDSFFVGLKVSYKAK